MTVPRDENMIAALKRERAVYANAGETDRVEQVDQQLKNYGYEGTQDADPGAPVVPQGRTAAGDQRTAEGDAIVTKPDGTATPENKSGKKAEVAGDEGGASKAKKPTS